MNSLMAIAAFCQLALGAYIDCEHYMPGTECTDDDACYIDDTANLCRADCSKIQFFMGQIDACNAYGCIANDTGYPEGYEGMIDCSSIDVTGSPTTSLPPTTAFPTSEPTSSDDTKAPSQAPVTMTTSMSTTMEMETTSTTMKNTNSGNGVCADDGIPEQVFGPGEYSCGDYNLGQPEERCLFIDASSSCTGTEFGQCGNESNPWPTFQSALDSLNGETVVLIVKAGTYSGEGNVNITSPNLGNLNEYVYLNIFSESGSDDTIIDCKGEGFGFHLYQTTIRLDGFTIINCNAPYRDTFSLPSYATNSYIQSAPDSGRLGGALFLDRTFITMNDMIIVNNGAEYGGGIFQYQNSIRMNNSIVAGNCATSSAGGIFLLFANLYMWNSYVVCNEADVFGGGIFTHQARADILTDSLVNDNFAEYADELFCDKTTVNVADDSNGKIRENDVDSWDLNEVITCIKSEWGSHTCAFYDEDRSIDFCEASDSDLIDPTNLLAAAVDEGECEVEIATPSPTATGATIATPAASTTTVNGTRAGTTATPPQTSHANAYKIFSVVIFVIIMIIM